MSEYRGFDQQFGKIKKLEGNEFANSKSNVSNEIFYYRKNIFFRW